MGIQQQTTAAHRCTILATQRAIFRLSGVRKCPKQSIGRRAAKNAASAVSPFISSSPSLILIFVGSRTAISYLVDLLWFRSLGYAILVFGRALASSGERSRVRSATFLILFGAFLRAPPQPLQPTCPIRIRFSSPAKPIELPVAKALHINGRHRRAVDLNCNRLCDGSAVAHTGPLLVRAPPATLADPIFNRPLGFYLSHLPAWQTMAGWPLTLGGAGCAFSPCSLPHCRGRWGARSAAHWATPVPLPWRGVSIAAGFLVFRARHSRVCRLADLLFEEHTIFDGVTFTPMRTSRSSECCLSERARARRRDRVRHRGD